MTLSEAIGEAGGPTPGSRRDMRKVQLMRAPDLKRISRRRSTSTVLGVRNASAEPLVQRGDVIMVAVHTPRPPCSTYFASCRRWGGCSDRSVSAAAPGFPLLGYAADLPCGHWNTNVCAALCAADFGLSCRRY